MTYPIMAITLGKNRAAWRDISLSFPWSNPCVPTMSSKRTYDEDDACATEANESRSA